MASGRSLDTNLWQLAFNKLDPNLRTRLTSLNIEKIDILQLVLDEAEQKKKLCVQKHLKVHLSGRVIILRDVFDKIITWVNDFKTIGDVVIQFDPLVAALPWAGVRFLLQAAISEKYCFESTIQGLESVSHVIARYAAFEALYIRGGPFLGNELQVKFEKLYGQVLVFLAHGVHYFSQPSSNRILKGIFQSSQSDQLKIIATLDEEFAKLARLSEAHFQQQIHSNVSNIQAIVKSLQSPIDRLVDVTAIYIQHLHQEKFTVLLNWLSSIPYSRHQERHSRERLPGTTTWLQNHYQYIEWKSSSSSEIFLLHGIPGSGKTNIVSAVVDTFITKKQFNPRAAPLAYFYCGDQVPIDVDEIMRSLTRQLAVIDGSKCEVHEQILLEYERRLAKAKIDGFELAPLQSSECVDLILQLLDCNPAVIVINGVDEIEKGQRHTLFKSLDRLKDESSNIVKIFLSSRDNVNIFAHLPNASKLRIGETETKQDMELFVHHVVTAAIETHNIIHGNVSESLKQTMIQFLSDRAGEMFLWVKLQIDRFSKLKTTRGLMEGMKDRSKITIDAINHLYSEFFDSIMESDAVAYGVAARAFSWLMCMQEPLTSKAFLAAVSTSDSDGHSELTLVDLLSACSNMIVLDTTLDIFRFAHLSVREFLEAKSEFQMGKIHIITAMSCIHSCTHDPQEDTESMQQPKGCFRTYAALYWGRHYRIAAAASPHDEALYSKMKNFIFYDEEEVSLSFLTWLRTVQVWSLSLPSDHVLRKECGALASSTITPFFSACVYGLMDVLKIITRAKDFDVDLTNLLGHTGLYLAAVFGHAGIVQYLLQLHANVDIKCGHHGSVLNAAAFGGHEQIVRQILLHEPPSQSTDSIQAALRTAFLAGNERIVQVILDTGVEITTQDSYDKILACAFQTNFVKVVLQLEKRYILFNKNSNCSPKLLDKAISTGQINFVKKHTKQALALDHAIATAALFGQEDMISMLLANGNKLEREGSFGTPLRVASLMGHTGAVRLLLESGADVNATGSFGDALQAASMQGHTSITQLLLRRGSSANNVGGYYGTPLQAAAYRGHHRVAEILLDAGAKITYRGICQDAFHAAAETGQENIIRLFLEKGYSLAYEHISSPWAENLNIPKMYKRSTNVALASLVSDFTTILKNTESQPISEGSQPQGYQIQTNRDSGDESYALEVAAERGHIHVVRTILKNRLRLDLSDIHICEALWVASERGHTEIVKLITPVPLDCRPYIPEALHRAAFHGHIAVIECLLGYKEQWGSARYEVEGSHAAIFINYVYEPGRSIADVFANKNVLRVLLSGCRGDQCSSVLRAFQLASESQVRIAQELAFEAAVIADSINVIEMLYQLDYLIDSQLFGRMFEAAAKHGSMMALSFLVKNRQEAHMPIELISASFKLAVSHNQTEIAVYLLQRYSGACSRELIESSFIDAARRGHTNILETLLPTMESSESYNAILSWSLNEACGQGHKDTTKLLLSAGAHPNELCDKLYDADDVGITAHRRGGHAFAFPICYRPQLPRTALQAALQTRAWAETQLSVQPGKSSGIRNKEELIKELESIIIVLVQYRADLKLAVCGMTPLHSAVLMCSEEVVQAMIDNGANVQAKSREACTPLELAVSRKTASLPIFRALLKAGAELMVEESKDGLTSPVLTAALKSFDDALRLNGGRYLSDYLFDNEGLLISHNIGDSFITGPAAIIKELLQLRSEFNAKDRRFGAVLELSSGAGEEGYVKLLTERNVDVRRFSPLRAASKRGHLECVKYLLNSGADPNVLQGIYGTALHSAVEGGHIEIVDALIEGGAEVNLRRETKQDPDAQLQSAIGLAVKAKNVAIIKRLIDAGANSEPGISLLHFAAGVEDLELLKTVLDAGFDVNSIYFGHPPVLFIPCRNGNLGMVELLVSRGVDVNAKYSSGQNGRNNEYWGESALHEACCTYKTQRDIVRILLEHEAALESQTKGSITPLGEAARSSRMEIMELLISHGALIYDISRDLNVLKDACSGFSPEAAIEFLLEKLSGSSILIPACQEAILESTGSCSITNIFPMLVKQLTPTHELLSLACMSGLTNAVEWMLAHGLDVNCDLGGGSPLHLAAYHQRLTLVEFLIANGANVQHVSSKFGSPLTAALEGLLASDFDGALNTSDWTTIPALLPTESLYRYCNDESQKDTPGESIIRAFLDSGVGINIGARALGHPIHLACYLSSMSLFKVLVDKGANLNASGSYFGSALVAAIFRKSRKPSHIACKEKNIQRMELLLANGADVNAVNSNEESPLAVLLSENLDTLFGANNGQREASEAHIDMLLERGVKFRVRSEDLLIAADLKRPSFRRYVIDHLLEHSDGTSVTHDMIRSIVAFDQKYLDSFISTTTDISDITETLHTLLKYAKDLAISPDILSSVSELSHLKLLLQHQPRSKFHPDTLETLAVSTVGRDSFSASRFERLSELLNIALEQRPEVLPSTKVVLAALKACPSFGNQSEARALLGSLFERNPSIEINEEMLAIASNIEQLEFLLSRSSRKFEMGEVLWKMVSSTDSGMVARFQTLLNHDREQEINPRVLKDCVFWSFAPCLELLLQRDPDLEMPEDFVQQLLANRMPRDREKTWLEVIIVLEKYNRTLVLKPKFRMALEEMFPLESDSELKERIWRLERMAA